MAFFSRFLCVALIGPTELSINVGRRPLGQIEKDAKYKGECSCHVGRGNVRIGTLELQPDPCAQYTCVVITPCWGGRNAGTTVCANNRGAIRFCRESAVNTASPVQHPHSVLFVGYKLRKVEFARAVTFS